MSKVCNSRMERIQGIEVVIEVKRVIFIIVTTCILLVSCDGTDNNRNQNTEVPVDRTSHLESELSEVREENHKSQMEIRALQEQVDQLTSRLEHFEELHEALLSEFNYEVIGFSHNDPSETVIYVHHVPEHLVKQERILIRAAIEFSTYDKVSLWRDKDAGLLYVNGDYDPEETALGWSGLDKQFGVIDHSSAPPILRHNYSRDDGTLLEFGKYKIP